MILKYLKPFIFPIILVVVLTFGQVIADLSLPNYMAHIVDKGIAQNDTPFIFRMGAIMLLVSLGGVVCAVCGGFFASRTALAVGRNIRSSLFAHVTRYSLAEFDQIGTASLITRTTNDVQQIQTSTFMILRMMMRAPVMCIGAIIMAIHKDGGLSVILLAILPVIIIMILVVSRKALPLFRSMQRKLDKLNMVLRENLVGIRIVRAFSRVGYEKRRFAAANDDLTRTSIRVNRIMAILGPAMMLSMNLLSIGIVWFASFRIDAGSLQIGDMMAFIQYAMQIFMSLMMLTMMFVMLPRALASAERIQEVLSLQPGVVDTEKTITIPAKKGYLTFNNATFRYKQAENPSVNDVSFTACPGETVAVIGGTGSGKSSLLDLILRYYDVESGEILIDGVDIRQISQEDLRDRIGYVPQHAVLFSGTISDNVRMGKQDATDEEIRHACHVAQASDFIEQMPDGYQSQVAQGGTNLSGGQKQRLSIARAIVRKPDIYVFDDSFSALDFKTDSKLRASLAKETKESIVIIVAQRVSSIMNADKILVMDKGYIIVSGTHRELLQTNEVYKEIVMSQLSGDEIR